MQWEHIYRKAQKYSFPRSTSNSKFIHTSKLITALHKSLKIFTIATVEFHLLNIFKKISKDVSEHYPYLTSFNLYFLLFYTANFEVYHYEHTPTGFVQNTDSRISWLLPQKYYQWNINSLTLPRCLTLPQVTLIAQKKEIFY